MGQRRSPDALRYGGARLRRHPAGAGAAELRHGLRLAAELRRQAPLWPAFVPITFEAMVFWAAIGTAVVAIVAGKTEACRSRRRCWSRPGHDHRFVLWISATTRVGRRGGGRVRPLDGDGVRARRCGRRDRCVSALRRGRRGPLPCSRGVIGLPADHAPSGGHRLDMADQPSRSRSAATCSAAGRTACSSRRRGPWPRRRPYPFAQNEAHLAGRSPDPLPVLPEVIAHGKFVYENVCITCHGTQGRATGGDCALPQASDPHDPAGARLAGRTDLPQTGARRGSMPSHAGRWTSATSGRWSTTSARCRESCRWRRRPPRSRRPPPRARPTGAGRAEGRRPLVRHAPSTTPVPAVPERLHLSNLVRGLSLAAALGWGRRPRPGPSARATPSSPGART